MNDVVRAGIEVDGAGDLPLTDAEIQRMQGDMAIDDIHVHTQIIEWCKPVFDMLAGVFQMDIGGTQFRQV
jgi:hypothetical protein